jgi:thioredoxin reductase
LEAVDAVLGSEHVLGIRFCADELAPWAGLTPEQSIEIVRLLVATGRIDYITVTMGSIFSTHMFPFHASMHTSPAYSASLAAAIKEVAALPVFAAGRVMNASQAEQLLAAGQADGVEMVRALIADPQLPYLSQVGQEVRVRPCIACNQGCQVRTAMNATIACNVNPDVLGERAGADDSRSAMSSTSPALLSRRGEALWVIGGGPAGMEAARTAALRGRQVVLYEREQALGGAVALAARGPGRGELAFITEYLQAEIERLGVEIHTGIEVTAEMVQQQCPGTVIVATGALPGTGLLPIPGSELSHVIDVRGILRGELIEGERVVVVDESDSHGVLSAIEMLAAAEKKVEVVGEYWYVGYDLTATHDIVPWLQRVLARDVTLTTHTKVLRIEPGQVIVSDNFAECERALPADVVVLGTYEQPDQQLYKALKGIVPRLWRIGDCVAPRRIQQAIVEGRQIAQRI